MKRTWMSLSLLALVLNQQLVVGQKRTENVWIKRAQRVTEEVVGDLQRLGKLEKALTLGRLADVWWRNDQERAHVWFKQAVELVEPIAGETLQETRCRLAVSRTILSLLSRRDAQLSKRLVEIISNKKQNVDVRDLFENATAIAAAAITLVDTDPEAAERLGEASLALGPTIRLGQLLWRLRAASPASGDRLFLKIRQAASLTSDSNLFSILLAAVNQGPFRESDHKRQILLSAAVYASRVRETAETNSCNLILLLSPLFSAADTLVPEHGQNLKEAFAICTKSSTVKARNDAENTPKLDTVEALLEAAGKTEDISLRGLLLSKAIQSAARDKNFREAIRILDSMNDEVKESLGDSWTSWRWDYGSAAACTSQKADDLQLTQRIIDETPPALRAHVRISVALNCDAFTSSEISELLNSARPELQRIEGAERISWTLSLVRLYGRFVPDATMSLLNEAVETMNRASKNSVEFCADPMIQHAVLTNQIILSQYKLPSTLWTTDEFGMLYALRLVRSWEMRSALRLNLIVEALTEHRRLEPSARDTGKAKG